MAAAVPPSRLSAQMQCMYGVTPEPGGNGFVASVSWRRQGSGTLLIEYLGTHAKPWFAAVAHDVALAVRAFHNGDRSLSRVESVSGGGGSYERLNFPLTCLTENEAFWDALQCPFGELVKRLRAPNNGGANLLVKVNKQNWK